MMFFLPFPEDIATQWLNRDSPWLTALKVFLGLLHVNGGPNPNGSQNDDAGPPSNPLIPRIAK